MKEIKDTCYKGTRILLGNEKRTMIDYMVRHLSQFCTEISIPIIQHQQMFSSKVGEENTNMMYNFKDRGARAVCLGPEYTAVVQQLARTHFSQQKDVNLFYVQECFRGEKPQAGRYRQFTQLGVEILNPTMDYSNFLSSTACYLISKYVSDVTVDTNAIRGLDYYKQGTGFEIIYQGKQLAGGGAYEGGVGFAIGIDRLLSLIP